MKHLTLEELREIAKEKSGHKNKTYSSRAKQAQAEIERRLGGAVTGSNKYKILKPYQLAELADRAYNGTSSEDY